MVPHLKKEDAACTANPNQISSTRPCLVGGIWAPRVSHHLDITLIADPNLIADTALIAEAPCPASHVTEITPPTQEDTSGQNSETNGSNTYAVASTENSKTVVPGAEGACYKELP